MPATLFKHVIVLCLFGELNFTTKCIEFSGTRCLARFKQSVTLINMTKMRRTVLLWFPREIIEKQGEILSVYSYKNIFIQDQRQRQEDEWRWRKETQVSAAKWEHSGGGRGGGEHVKKIIFQEKCDGTGEEGESESVEREQGTYSETRKQEIKRRKHKEVIQADSVREKETYFTLRGGVLL